MKKISSVLLAFLMLVSSLFCANAAFGEDWSSQSGKNTFQSAENLVIGTIYNRPATEITGTVFKLDLNQAAKYTLSISSNSAAKVEIYQNDDKNIIDTVFVLGDKAQKKVTDKNFDFLHLLIFQPDIIHIHVIFAVIPTKQRAIKRKFLKPLKFIH